MEFVLFERGVIGLPSHTHLLKYQAFLTYEKIQDRSALLSLSHPTRFLHQFWEFAMRQKGPRLLDET